MGHLRTGNALTADANSCPKGTELSAQNLINPPKPTLEQRLTNCSIGQFMWPQLSALDTVAHVSCQQRKCSRYSCFPPQPRPAP